MVVMDSFALPVEGTETRVNAHEQAYEYMTAYMESANRVSSIIFLLTYNSCIYFLKYQTLTDRNIWNTLKSQMI